MPDPVSVGVFASWALGLAGEAIVKGLAAESVKDAYGVLKAKVAAWAGGDVEELEKSPASKSRQGVIAERLDGLPAGDQSAVRELAQALAAELAKHAPAIGLDIGRLTAAEVQLGDIKVAGGVGARIQDATVSGTFKTGDIAVGSPPGKP